MRTRVSLLIALAVIGCQKQEESVAPPPPAAKSTATHARIAAGGAGATESITSGLSTPESVLYDAQQDVYFISNINGQPLQADNNGYISRVNAETLQIEPKWIEAGKNGVKLDAPKGSAIVNGTLYVADITVVRKFDAKSGAPKGKIAIPGAVFLNDIVADGSTIYVSDTGMKAGAGGNFEPAGADAIWKITNDKPQKIASGDDLKHPNGVDVVNGKLWVVSFGSNELYQIDNGKKTHVMQLPKGSLDGLFHLDDGSFVVSSWEGKAVYRGKDDKWQTVVDNVNAPADIGYDAKRHRMLIPHFMDSIVTIHPLQ